ncbi:hypothetical protein [Psychrobacter raelei]|uniref:hypothetical protein n=1 Tax=Psychrobacter raelei TaxID=2565531 RepID=UPI003F6344FD
MKQSLFNKLEVGTPVSYQGIGTINNDFYYVITKINKDNQTVDIERYLQLTLKPDTDNPIYKEGVSLDKIDFFHSKDKLAAQLDPSKLSI